MLWGILTLAIFASPAIAQLQPGNPLSGIEKFKDFEARRASSCDPDWRNGNEDARPIAAGGTLVLADLKGPGVITHIWNTINHEAQFYSRLMTLRIYWDGEEHPSVECPIGDFFGIGHGVDQSFMSIPIRVTSNGKARNCYWPMPFRKSARITVTNESDKPCKWFYFYVDWQKHESLPADAAYFHAMYRQEFPCVMGQNYLIADLEGRGHYVGTVQSVYLMSQTWYGEGDDFFFIDGETEPSLRGTGTEDYFCDAWGFRQQDGPFYGTPMWEGNNPGGRGSAYRFHLADPVPFKKSLRVEIEHKGAQKFPDAPRTNFIERDDLMSSVAFWYQGEPHKPWPALPPGQERLPFRETTLSVGWEAVETARHSDGPIRAEKLRQIATGDKYLLFNPDDDKGWVEIPFRVEKEMSAELWGKMIQSTNGGTYRVSLDGKEVGAVDLRADDFATVSHVWGRHQLSAGEHVLRFDCVDKTVRSPGHALGFDALIARTFAYTRPPGFDLRKVQVTK
jgi:hypothetical protein